MNRHQSPGFITWIICIGLSGTGSFHFASGQSPNWSEHIAPILYANCTPCHRAGEVAPFPLLTYEDAITFSTSIKEQTSAGLMPPWPADPLYRHYLDETVLSELQKIQIAGWVDNGLLLGDTALAPELPVYPEGSQLGIPDTVLSMASAYFTTADGKDRYMVFVLPSGFLSDKNVAALEFRPGNKGIIHHVFIYTDTSGSVAALDAATPEYGFEGFSPTIFSSSEFITLHRPGMKHRLLPEGIAYRIPAGADIIFQIHYAPVDFITQDSSSVNVFFSEQDSVRTVLPLKVTEAKMIEPQLLIPANTVATFHSEAELNDGDQSWISVSPHAHQLCSAFRVFGVGPSGDTIPLVNIPQWSFDWQLLYSFTSLQKMEDGTKLYAEATFDNTSNNPNNPNNPPIDVHYGLGSEDEMFRYFFMAVPYKEGDEFLVLDSSVYVPAPFLSEMVSMPQLYPVAPNPSNGSVQISFLLPAGQPVELRVTDLLGNRMTTISWPTPLEPGFHHIPLDCPDWASGTYILSLVTAQGARSRVFVIE